MLGLTEGPAHLHLVSVLKFECSNYTLRDVQYIGGDCSVHRREIMIHVGGYHVYTRGVQYIRGIPQLHWGDIMIHVGKQIDKSL